MLVVGDAPFRLKFALKVTHPFEKRRLQQISAYNVSNVRDSEQSSMMAIGSRPWAFQRAIDRVRTLPLSPQRMIEKAIFYNKIRFQSNSLLQSFFV